MSRQIGWSISQILESQISKIKRGPRNLPVSTTTSTTTNPAYDGFLNTDAVSGITTDFANALSGSINIKMIQIGDSNIEYGQNNAQAWRTTLPSNGYAIKGSQWSNIFAVSNSFNNFRNWYGVGWSNLSDWTDEGSTSLANGNSVTLYTSKSTPSTVNPYIAINYAGGPAALGNVMKVYYRPQVGGGTITMRKNIDGATDLAAYLTAGSLWTTIDTSDLSGSLVPGLKVATLDATGVYSFGVLPTDNVEIYGLQLYSTDTKGIHFIALGHSGTGGISFAARTPTDLWKGQLAEIGKNLAVGDKTYIFYNLGTNDFRGNTSTAAQYKTYMQTNITETLATLPNAKIILQGAPRHDYASYGGSNAKRLEFNSKLIELAYTNNCLYWDLNHVIDSDYAAYSDGLHWTLDGNTALANSFITKFAL